jgi:hypothetical protein
MVAGCAGTHQAGGGDRPSQAELRAHHYQDSSGLLVGTYGGWLRQRLPAGTTGELALLADYVRIDPGRGFDPTRPDADRSAPDAVTSASASAGGGQVSREWRFEGQGSFGAERTLAGALLALEVVARGSTEPDYRSLSGGLRTTAELDERNTGLALQIGYGRDSVRPVEVFHGQEQLWPAHHRRWAGTLSAWQVLGARLLARAGVTATFQRGTLASPYRRAVVAPNLLLPETLPRARDRYSGHVGLSWSITPRLALHLDQGGYADSWSVEAIIPEARLAAELGEGVLLEGGYRYYRQSRARFYAVTYPEAQEIMTGDTRLGGIRDHSFALEVRRALRPGRRLALPLLLGYQLSSLRYRGVGARVIAHVFHLGLGSAY